MLWFEIKFQLDLNLFCAKDLVYKLKKIVGSNNFSAQFIKIISHYKNIGYNVNVLQQTACMLGGQPNQGWQFCFSRLQTLSRFQPKD